MAKIIRKIKSTIRNTHNYFIRKALKKRDFTIISNNCWAGFVYRDLGIEYRSPFVGMYIFAPDYMKLIKNLRFYLDCKLEFSNESKYADYINEGEKGYPIGMLDDVEIHFLHYKDETEAREKWVRRTARINWNNIFVKFSDRDLCTDELLAEFADLDLPNKICFTSKKMPVEQNFVWFREFSGKPCVDKEGRVYKKYFNVAKWLNSG